MITLISGPIHSGKTTRLINEYSRCVKGDGFAAIKIMHDDTVEGFDMMKLSTGFKFPLARRKSAENNEWNQCCSYGPYTFSKDAIETVTEEVIKLMINKENVIFLDEIGSLELADLCFNDIVKKIVASGVDAVFTVRDTNLLDVIDKYGIIEPRIIETGERFA